MNGWFKYIIRFILFILVQVFVLDKILLHQLVTPYLYFLFILWLPFKINRSWLMIIAFGLGLTLDYFRHYPGFHAAACVLIAYIRPFLINLLLPKEDVEINYAAPSVTTMGGFTPYALYVTVLTLLHNSWLFFLEALQFGSIWYFLGKTLLSTLISLLMILVIELIFVRKEKYRTNTF